MEETTITSLAEYTALETSLHTLASRAKYVTEPDKKLRIELRDARVWLEKTGKFLRDDYNRLAKDVIAKEKELIGIIAPAEEALKSLEEAVEAEKERLYRVSRFEARAERMASLGLQLPAALNEEMSDVQFDIFFQVQVAEVNAKKDAELAAREQKIREEEERQARIKRDEEWAARIREEEAQKAAKAIADAEERAKRAEQDAKEKAERDERDRIAQEEADRLAKEKKEADEKQRLERDVMYQTFLESHGWNASEDFMVERKDGKILLYKLVATLELE